jgi:hypothetical protein
MSISPFRKRLYGILSFLLALLIVMPALGQEDSGLKPDETGVEAVEEPDEFGVKASDMAAIRSNILNAENSKLNKRVSINIDNWLRFGMFGLSDFPAVLGGGSPPTRKTYDAIDYQVSINFGYSMRGGNMSGGLVFQPQLDNVGGVITSIGLGNGSFSSSLGGVSYKVLAGYGNLQYVISGSPVDRPLLAGDLKGQNLEQTVWLFERVPWTEAKSPAGMYKQNFDGLGELLQDENFRTFNENGVGLELKLPAGINMNVLAVRDSFSPIVGVNKKLGPVTLGFGYARNVMDPNLDYHPTYLGNTYEGSLVGSVGFLSGSIDVAYSDSTIDEYIITNHKFIYRDSPPIGFDMSGLKETRKYGRAALATVWTKKGKFLFFEQNQLLLRGFFSDPGFDPTLNAVGDVNYRFTDVVTPVDSLHDINQLLPGGQTIFLSDRFDFLSGKVRLTAGATKMQSKTPDVYRLPYYLNSKVWHLTGGLYGSDYYGPAATDIPTAYKSVWQQDWTAEYEGASQVAWSYYDYTDIVTNTGLYTNTYNYRIPVNSRKNFSMITIDYSWNLGDVFELPVAVYLAGRWQSSAIFVGNALGLPFKGNADKEIDYYTWFHYVAVPLTGDIVVNCYFGVERNQHLRPVTQPTIDKHAWDGRKILPGEKLGRFNKGLFFLPIDEKDIGYGFGLDWYFKDGLGLYIKTHFAQQADTTQDFTMKGYGVRVELRKYFSY